MEEVAGRWGKWSLAGVPHKGWVCEEIVDMGRDDLVVCEMCEQAEVRYVHVMKHDDWPDRLEVGCVCAERMGEEKAREREQELKRIAGNPAKADCLNWLRAADEILKAGGLSWKEEWFVRHIRAEMVHSVKPRTKCYRMSERQIGWFMAIYGMVKKLKAERNSMEDVR